MIAQAPRTTSPGETVSSPENIDGFGRTISYLRISLTDRCNLRCLYCMPAEGMTFMHPSHYLSREELNTVLRVAVQMGIRKIRFTGGEPTLRPELVEIVRDTRAIEGVEEIALSTNAVLLDRKAAALKEAGVDRVNISLDTLRPERFRQMTRLGDIEKVFAGIRAAWEAGMRPLKINTVVMRGQNEDEIAQLAALTQRYPIEVRFIEYMPIGVSYEVWRASFVPAAEILRACEQNGALEHVPQERYSGPAERYQYLGAPGKIGVIHAVSTSFCGYCNRIRMTADGLFKPCLHSDHVFDVKEALRTRGEEGVRDVLRQVLRKKPLQHHMQVPEGALANTHYSRLNMSQMGG